jgi:hypothetical protein
MRVSQGVAVTSLEGAKIALSVAQSAISIAPVELDPEIITLTASKEIIIQAIEALKLALKGTGDVFHAVTDITGYIRKYGSTADILKISGAGFQCKLDVIKDSTININFKNVEFMGVKVFDTLGFSFDFSNPMKSIQELITGHLLR